MKVLMLSFFVFLCTMGAVAQFQPPVRELYDFDGYSNAQYADWMRADGWPVDILNTGKNADYLTDAEKTLILVHNLVRFDPPKFSELYVFPRLQYFEGTLFRFPGKDSIPMREGLEAVRELYLELKNTKPRNVFLPSPGLSKAAQSHAEFLKKTGETSHQGKGGISTRANMHGKWVEGLAENINWMARNPHEAVLIMLIDDGIFSRSHRKNIMNPNYTVIGVGIDAHPRFKKSYVVKYAVNYLEK